MFYVAKLAPFGTRVIPGDEGTVEGRREMMPKSIWKLPS